ncbi:MAG: hypothetical protein A2044_02240 [Candidatus Firestonebacteria bacterium GWA2_43_8]|nr:MAG: hypothetical protein A2044_02240 [Candidatus Firestonebacteria bacterium GWA2_43_8]
MASIKFFDSHIHIYTGCEGRCTELMASGRVDGMNLILLSPSYKDHEKLNEEGFALKKKYGKMVQLAYWADLGDKNHIKAAEKAFKKHPEITGIKIHPGGNGVEINEKNCGKIFDFAKERELYVITHTQPTEGANAGAFRPVMGKRKDVRFILGHASPIEEAVYMALSFENCYVEPCWLAHFSLMFEMMGRLFKYKKMLVGTDGPMRFPTWKVDDVRVEVIEEEISYARKMLPSMKEVQLYCYDNAIEFFRLK